MIGAGEFAMRNWRRESVWNPTVSPCKYLISLEPTFARIRIPFPDPSNLEAHRSQNPSPAPSAGDFVEVNGSRMATLAERFLCAVLAIRQIASIELLPTFSDQLK